MRPCRRHGHANGMLDGCHYCWRKYHTDIQSVLRPEDRLLRQIFGEGRFYTVNTKTPRRVKANRSHNLRLTSRRISV